MKQSLGIIIYISITSLILAACGRSATPTQVMSETPIVLETTPVAGIPTTAPNDPCLNVYFPVRRGATWTYASSGSPLGSFSFEKQVREVQPGQFEVNTGIDGKVLREVWLCRPEGLVAQSMVLMDASTLQALNKFNEIQVTNVIGMNLPPSITTGTTWSLSYDIQGVQMDQTNTVVATMNGKVIISYTAISQEQVTVPAGSFDTVSVSMATTITFAITQAGGTANINASSQYTTWFAPGVGWVKSSGSGSVGGSDYFETIELQTFTIP